MRHSRSIIARNTSKRAIISSKSNAGAHLRWSLSLAGESLDKDSHCLQCSSSSSTLKAVGLLQLRWQKGTKHSFKERHKDEESIIIDKLSITVTREDATKQISRQTNELRLNPNKETCVMWPFQSFRRSLSRTPQISDSLTINTRNREAPREIQNLSCATHNVSIAPQRLGYQHPYLLPQPDLHGRVWGTQTPSYHRS